MEKIKREPVVFEPDAIVDPFAMMVELLDASLALLAMFTVFMHMGVTSVAKVFIFGVVEKLAKILSIIIINIII